MQKMLTCPGLLKIYNMENYPLDKLQVLQHFVDVLNSIPSAQSWNISWALHSQIIDSYAFCYCRTHTKTSLRKLQPVHVTRHCFIVL